MANTKAPAKPTNPFLDPSTPLSGPALDRAAHALANAQINPPVQALRQQIRQSNRQVAGAVNKVGGYYNQLGQQAQQGVTNAQNIAAGLNQQLGQIGQNESTTLGQLGQQAQQAYSKYTPQTDGANSLGASGYGSLASELARQQGLASQGMAGLQSFGASEGANGVALANSALGVGAMRGQEALKAISQAGQEKVAPIKDKIAQLLAQKGSLYTTNLGKLRQQEIANQVTAAGLGIKKTEAATSAKNADTAAYSAETTRQNDLAMQLIRTQTLTEQNRHNLAVEGIDGDRIQATIRGQNLAHQDRQAANATRQAALNLTSGRGATKPLSTYENNKTLGILSKLETAIATMQTQGITAGAKGATYQGKKYAAGQVMVAHPSEQQIRSALASADPLGGLLIQAAYELQHQNGAISPQTARNLHNAGIRGGTYKNAPIKVQTPTGASVSQGVSGVVGGLNGLLG